MSKKEITKIAKRFKRQMQKIVDNGGGITEIKIQIKDSEPVVIAKKTKKRKLTTK